MPDKAHIFFLLMKFSPDRFSPAPWHHEQSVNFFCCIHKPVEGNPTAAQDFIYKTWRYCETHNIVGLLSVSRGWNDSWSHCDSMWCPCSSVRSFQTFSDEYSNTGKNKIAPSFISSERELHLILLFILHSSVWDSWNKTGDSDITDNMLLHNLLQLA